MVINRGVKRRLTSLISKANILARQRGSGDPERNPPTYLFKKKKKEKKEQKKKLRPDGNKFKKF